MKAANSCALAEPAGKRTRDCRLCRRRVAWLGGRVFRLFGGDHFICRQCAGRHVEPFEHALDQQRRLFIRQLLFPVLPAG